MRSIERGVILGSRYLYGVYSLFIRSEQQEAELSLPEWLQIAGLLVLPICAVLLAAALRLVRLHPKPDH